MYAFYVNLSFFFSHINSCTAPLICLIFENVLNLLSSQGYCEIMTIVQLNIKKILERWIISIYWSTVVNISTWIHFEWRRLKCLKYIFTSFSLYHVHDCSLYDWWYKKSVWMKFYILCYRPILGDEIAGMSGVGN